MRAFETAGTWVGLVLCALALGSCGGDEPPADGPLEGRELGRAGQLEGTWLGVSQGDFIGFEFMDDGKVLATPITAALTGGAAMYDYSVLEGGRLSLMAPDGRTVLYKVTLAGDHMELEGSMMLSATNSQRFRRLPGGQTLEEGIEEQQRLDEAAYQERHDALTEYLERDDLVMAPVTPGAGGPAAIALDLTADGPGRGWYDDAPPHLDELHAAIDSVENDAALPALQITFGEQLDPPPQQVRGASQITFNSSGDADEPRLVAQVTYGSTPVELEIRRDAKLHADIVGRFDAEKERVEALRGPLLAALKDYAVVEGQSGAQYENQATSDRFVLVRDAASGKFSGEGVLGYTDRPAQAGTVTADVVVFGDEAMLVIEGLYRRYEMALAGSGGGQLSGAWFPTGTQNGWQSTLAITEAIDTAERERRADAQRKALRALDPDLPYVGRAAVLVDAWGAPQPFVILAVTPGASDSYTATARYPSISMEVAMSGGLVETLTGPVLQLRASSMKIDPGMAGMMALNLVERQVTSQVWSLTLAEPGEAASRLEGGGTGMGAVSLEPMTDAWKRRQADAVRQALSAGAKFDAWAVIYRDQPATVFEHRLDASSGALTAVVPERSASMNIRAGQTFAGKLTEADGIPQADFAYTMNNMADYTMRWWAYVEPDDDILLIGNFAQVSTGKAWAPGFEMQLAR
ncbi:MAG TPA: hypothetical protein VFY03_01640 [Woeseiaceae bacterium]|nr:hypothetical protein [Woeseiaceae bacterium]